MSCCVAYDQLIKEGHNPYFYFNKADKDFIKETNQASDNIVIKTVTKQGTGAEETTQYNNDLTALLQIAEDKSNLMPWAADNFYIDSVGYVPWRPSKLPIYCYHIDFWNTIDINQADRPNQWREVRKGIQWDNIQFIPIENMVDIELLRTGDKWDSGPYKFQAKPTALEYHWQSTRHTGSCHPTTTPTTEGGQGQNIASINSWQWGDRNNPSLVCVLCLVVFPRLRPMDIVGLCHHML
jgi:hypothetical protein